MILFALSCTLFLSACPRDEEPILTEQISEDRLLGQVNSLSLTQISSHMIADMEIEGSLPLVNGKMEKVLTFSICFILLSLYMRKICLGVGGILAIVFFLLSSLCSKNTNQTLEFEVFLNMQSKILLLYYGIIILLSSILQ